MPLTTAAPTGRLLTREGVRWYRIDALERLEPFLTTVVSDSDLWLFVSSAGPLTAGRVDADHALLPYETDDRLHRAVGVTGPVSLLTRGTGPDQQRWEPFARRIDPGCTRAIEKDELGTAVTFEETNPAWGLRLRVTWEPSAAYGWVRSVELEDLSGDGAELEVTDGLLDVMPAGVDAETERRASNLVDAYKRAETGAWGSAAVYALESRITDRAEPSESLMATLVWSLGFEDAEVHLDERVLAAAWQGAPVAPTPLLTGRRGAYLLRGTLTVPPGGRRHWRLVADIGLGHAALHERIAAAGRPDVEAALTADIARGRQRLAALLAAADAEQHTADAVADLHHRSNVLFNSMRGGLPTDGEQADLDDVLAFLKVRNRRVHDRHRAALEALGTGGTSVPLAELRAMAEASGDADLIRLVLEYLPLSFARRHGDPSRPWNRFSIQVTTEDGRDLRHYEGNWRDIFQNWEALLRSYPRLLPGVVATFVNASTPDGHNPYRISRDGIDWEVPDPEDPWSNIGYWGDHQLVYLLRLLEAWEATDPGALTGWLDRPLFTYADVPYRLAGYPAMLIDPRDTVTYDRDQAAAVERRVASVGADGRLVVADDEVVRVSFAEKLLVPALGKLTSFVAGGGIWMNTQRPEWNDGNNALAGWGLSMVTLYHLERYLAFLTRVLVPDEVSVPTEATTDATTHATTQATTDATTAASDDADPLTLSRPVAAWLTAIGRSLAAHDPHQAASDPRVRRSLLDALGTAGTEHREALTAGFDPTPVAVERDDLAAILTDAQRHVAAGVATGRRDDGLFHAYNTLSVPGSDIAEVSHLPLMLEGQVAALGTGVVSDAEVVAVVDRLFDSPLYRADQHSFLLAPPPARPAFLERNRIPASRVHGDPALERLAATPRGGILERGPDGDLHLRADLVNAAALEQALEAAEVPAEDRAAIHALYEQQFDPQSFLGRSGGMHGYEGIGSIYWHMVAKLLLAVQERVVAAEAAGADPDVLDGLIAAYRRIRDGLGFRKDPATYGAFPTDCYSHTPAHAGAQQPGMTGQVKEEILTRAGELGLRLSEGSLAWGSPLLPDDELWTELDGERSFELHVCGIPVRVRPGTADELCIINADGDAEVVAGRRLPPKASAAVFDRSGQVARLEVTLARSEVAPADAEAPVADAEVARSRHDAAALEQQP